MKLLQFSFKSEAVWIVVFSLLPAAIGIVLLLIAMALEVLR